LAERAIVETIRKFVETLKKVGINVDRVILYGSCAKGEPKPESDIDLAIVSRDFGKDPIEERMSLFRIAGGIDTRIEPVALSLISYENDTWLPLIYEIRTKGVEVKVT
jgi:predicted nucleotidyltransferase